MEKWQPGLMGKLKCISFVGDSLNLLDILDHEEGKGHDHTQRQDRDNKSWWWH